MDRQELIEWMAGQGRVKTVVEVGVYRGAFARALYRTLRPEKLVLVDPWRRFGLEEYGDYPKLHQADWDALYWRVVNSFEGWPGVLILRATSERAAPTVPDGSADLVYIDANHAYEHVRQDIARWYPKVRPGGWLAGHDYDLPGVRRAVAESVLGPVVQHTTKERMTKTWYAVKE